MAATEARLGVKSTDLRFNLQDLYLISDAENDVFYENTLAQVDPTTGENGTATPVDHSDGDDDSGLLILASKRHQDEDAFAGGQQRVGQGKTQRVELTHGYLVELEVAEADAGDNYNVGDTVYAVDNETVSASQGDGSGGNYAEAGTVYQVLDTNGTVFVYVPGIL
jgi:hypothetical protein